MLKFPAVPNLESKGFFRACISMLKKARKLIESEEEDYVCYAIRDSLAIDNHQIAARWWLVGYISFLMFDVFFNKARVTMREWLTSQGIVHDVIQIRQYRLMWIDHMITVFQNYIEICDTPYAKHLTNKLSRDGRIEILLQLAIVKTLHDNGKYPCNWAASFHFRSNTIAGVFAFRNTIQGFDYWRKKLDAAIA